MHILIGILIGMGVAATLIILWVQGNLFACVFLSIPPALGLLIFTLQDGTNSPNHVDWAIACLALLAVVWMPHYCLRRRLARTPRYYR
jgi:hypothetical protein